jgi:hypothetical protein
VNEIEEINKNFVAIDGHHNKVVLVLDISETASVLHDQGLM